MTDQNDLLAELTEDHNAEVIDLLSSLTDAGAPAWVPEEAGEGIQGTITGFSEQDDEYNPGEKVPVVTVELADGEKVRVIGFASVLRRELRDADLEIGNTIAVKYFGERELTKGKFKGKPYKLFKVATKRNRAQAA